MRLPRLIYLGPIDVLGSAAPKALECEGKLLEPGDVLVLERRRSPWKLLRGIERVIVGSHPGRADLRLDGEGIHPEHVRFYIDTGGGPTDVRPLKEQSTWVNGVPVEALEWSYVHGGEEIRVASWRFRYESAASPAPPYPAPCPPDPSP